MDKITTIAGSRKIIKCVYSGEVDADSLPHGKGKMDYIAGKYSSLVGPAFALMYNAITGYAEDFRDNGKALRVHQCLWIAENANDYNAKYALSQSESMNAFNYEDLAGVIREYNPNATMEDLLTLAHACSYEDVLARRGG